MMVTRLLNENPEPDRSAAAGLTLAEQLDLLEVERDALIALIRAREKILIKYGRINRPLLPPRIQR